MDNFIDKLALVQIKNRKVMLNWETGKTVWIMPGGKRESGESDITALKRELMEELSIELLEATALLFAVYQGQAHGKPEGTMVRITCYTGEYSGVVKPNPPVERIGWIGSSEENLSVPGKLLIEDLKTRKLID